MLNKDQEAYIRKFYCPQVSAYDFMCLFIAELLKEKETAFNRDRLMDFICTCKKRGKYRELLEDIQIKNNGAFLFSEKLTETVSMLKLVNILYTVSPEVDSIIYINKKVSPIQLQTLRQQSIEKMQSFVKDYENYQVRYNQNIYTQLAEQEEKAIKTLTRLK